MSSQSMNSQLQQPSNDLQVRGLLPLSCIDAEGITASAKDANALALAIVRRVSDTSTPIQPRPLAIRSRPGRARWANPPEDLRLRG